MRRFKSARGLLHEPPGARSADRAPLHPVPISPPRGRGPDARGRVAHHAASRARAHAPSAGTTPATAVPLLTRPAPVADPVPVSALLPPLLLLLWSGAVATLVTSFVLAPLLGEPHGAIALAPQHPRLGQAALLGLLVLPLLFGAAFAIIHEANLLTGLALGSLHAAALAARSVRSGGQDLLRDNRNRLLLCLAYGALLGFTYVTP